MISILDRVIPNKKTIDYTTIFQSVLNGFKEKGGTLYVPAGEYEVGSLRLYDNTTIVLEAGAVLKASANKELYPVITEEDIEGFVRGTRQGILYSLNTKNITIKGEGTIDGCGYNWWDSGESDEMRPRTIQFINVDRVTIEGIKIVNSPCWTVHPIRCNNVTIHNISICNPYDSPNTDGINPESCSNVRISNCYVDVGDDCLTLKSGLECDIYQRQTSCENITVSNCTFIHGHGGIVIGSEMTGGVKNVVVTNCVFKNTDRGIRIKTRRKRCGFVEDILINNIIMDSVDAGITMNEYYQCGASKDDIELFSLDKMPVDVGTPVIQNVIISNVRMKNVYGAGIYFLGLPEKPITGISISNVSMDVVGSEKGKLSIMAYVVENSFGEGINLRNVNDVTIDNCSIKSTGRDVILENAKETYLNGKSVGI